MWTIMKPQELPKWKGLEDIGRMDKIGPERHIEIVHAFKSYKDIM